MPVHVSLSQNFELGMGQYLHVAVTVFQGY